MKEILFKAKDKYSGEWAYGDYWNRDGDHTIIQHENYYIPATKDCYIEMVEVDGLTVCQYTGLKDRNGDKVFEGDILSDFFARSMKFTVYYNDNDGRYILKENNGEERTMVIVPTLEVIGNKCDDEFEYRQNNKLEYGVDGKAIEK